MLFLKWLYSVLLYLQWISCLNVKSPSKENQRKLLPNCVVPLSSLFWFSDLLFWFTLLAPIVFWPQQAAIFSEKTLTNPLLDYLLGTKWQRDKVSIEPVNIVEQPVTPSCCMCVCMCFVRSWQRPKTELKGELLFTWWLETQLQMNSYCMLQDV